MTDSGSTEPLGIKNDRVDFRGRKRKLPDYGIEENAKSQNCYCVAGESGSRRIREKERNCLIKYLQQALDA